MEVIFSFMQLQMYLVNDQVMHMETERWNSVRKRL